jgi:hypothetical protein
MKKIAYSLMVMIATSMMTSCNKLVEIGIMLEPTKYYIEMNMTYDDWGLDNTFISTYTEDKYNPIRETLDFSIKETYDNGRLIMFGLTRENVPIPCNNEDETHKVYIGFGLRLQDIPLQKDTKYYFGDVEGVDTSDGVVASGHISMWGGMELQKSTSGWIKFTRLELTHDNDEGYADDYEIDLEFEFEVRDHETGEITLKVENGKVIANPGQWEVQ